MTAPATRVVTPRASNMVLRATSSPALQATVSQGDPLLVTDRLPDGFLEVDWAQRRWFVLENDTQPWTGTGPSAASASPAPPAGGFGRRPERPDGMAQPPAWQTPPPDAAGGRGYPSRTRGFDPSQNPGELLPFVAILAALLVMVGSFAPWVHASFLGFGGSASGTDVKDGKITLALAIAAAVVAGAGLVLPRYRVWLMGLALASLLGSGGYAAYDWIDAERVLLEKGGQLRSVGVDVGVSRGLILVTIASGVGAVFSLASVIREASAGRR